MCSCSATVAPQAQKLQEGLCQQGFLPSKQSSLLMMMMMMRTTASSNEQLRAVPATGSITMASDAHCSIILPCPRPSAHPCVTVTTRRSCPAWLHPSSRSSVSSCFHFPGYLSPLTCHGPCTLYSFLPRSLLSPSYL